ncbi:MAG TPA: DUF3108 domain-containing protein [Candidatus Angelobacter sp.]|nr:DUF3108 domain-containing protein [Candidatus Angelobacter sp.]
MIPLRDRLIKISVVVLAAWLAVGAVAANAPVQGKKKSASPAPAPPPAEQSGMSAPTLTKPRSEYQFPVGQTYVYGGDWRIFNAGVATLRLEQAGPENRVVGTANSVGTVALLYHVHDRFESFFDPTNFCSRNTSRHVEEGLRRVETNITFDYRRGKTILDQKNIKKKETKHEEHDIPSCVTDLLSAVYYVASLPLLPGGNYSFPLNDGGQTLTVNVRVEAREQVKTPAGTFNAIRIQPESAAGLLKEKGRIWIWYSDDAARTPVQIRARMSWGTLNFMLLRVDKK